MKRVRGFLIAIAAITFVLIVATMFAVQTAYAQVGWVSYACTDGVIVSNYSTEQLMISYRVAQRPTVGRTYWLYPGYTQLIKFNSGETLLLQGNDYTNSISAEYQYTKSPYQNCIYPPNHILLITDLTTEPVYPGYIFPTPVPLARQGRACRKDFSGTFDLQPISASQHLRGGVVPTISKIAGPGRYSTAMPLSGYEGISTDFDHLVPGKFDVFVDCRQRNESQVYTDPTNGLKYSIEQCFVVGVGGEFALEFCTLSGSMTREVVLHNLNKQVLRLGPDNRVDWIH